MAGCVNMPQEPLNYAETRQLVWCLLRGATSRGIARLSSRWPERPHPVLRARSDARSVPNISARMQALTWEGSVTIAQLTKYVCAQDSLFTDGLEAQTFSGRQRLPEYLCNGDHDRFRLHTHPSSFRTSRINSPVERGSRRRCCTKSPEEGMPHYPSTSGLSVPASCSCRQDHSEIRTPRPVEYTSGVNL
jgi:hypothetical protein